MSSNHFLYNGMDIEIYGYSVYPHFSNNNTDQMVGELLIRNKAENPKIQMRHYILSKDMREMGEKLISMANSIDAFNEKLESDG